MRIGTEAYGSAYFGEGTGQVMISSLNCPAGSTHVLNCTSTPPVASTCSHNQDAGIRCRNVSVCELAGHTSCCTGPEELCSVGECYCDALCHTFEDCCANIENTCSGENTLVHNTVHWHMCNTVL